MSGFSWPTDIAQEASAALGSVNVTPSATTVNVCSISNLPAGFWNVSGIVYFLPAVSTTVNALHASIGTVSATGNNTVARFAAVSFNAIVMAANDYFSLVIPPFLLTLLSPTTVYLTASAQFATSTVSAGGFLHAER